METAGKDSKWREKGILFDDTFKSQMTPLQHHEVHEVAASRKGPCHRSTSLSLVKKTQQKGRNARETPAGSARLKARSSKGNLSNPRYPQRIYWWTQVVLLAALSDQC